MERGSDQEKNSQQILKDRMDKLSLEAKENLMELVISTEMQENFDLCMARYSLGNSTVPAARRTALPTPQTAATARAQ